MWLDRLSVATGPYQQLEPIMANYSCLFCSFLKQQTGKSIHVPHPVEAETLVVFRIKERDMNNNSPRFISDIFDCCRVSLSAQWGGVNTADSTEIRDTCLNAHMGCWGCVYKPNKSHQLSASKAFVFNEICILLIHLECGCRRFEGWHQLNLLARFWLYAANIRLPACRLIILTLVRHFHI